MSDRIRWIQQKIKVFDSHIEMHDASIKYFEIVLERPRLSESLRNKIIDVIRLRRSDMNSLEERIVCCEAEIANILENLD